MEKYHSVFRDNDTEKIGLICRAINFLEDIYEDAECEDIQVSIKDLDEGRLVVEPINCRYDPVESISVFSKQYDLDNVMIGSGDYSLWALYDHLINVYRETLHYKMLSLSGRTRTTGYEYYMGVLFDGSCFIVEGEHEYVRIPGMPQCLSAHTHPSPYPIPSSTDLKTITQLLIDRGIGHIIVSYGPSLAIYRVRPLTIDDLEYLKTLNMNNPVEALKIISRIESIRLRYI